MPCPTALTKWAAVATGGYARGLVAAAFAIFHGATSAGGDQRIRGLVRVTPEGAARLMSASGCIASGLDLFVEATTWGADNSIEPCFTT